jgi:hypothetical protein
VTQSNETALYRRVRDLLAFLQGMDKRIPQPVWENMYSKFILLRNRSISVISLMRHSICPNFLARMLVFPIL